VATVAELDELLASSACERLVHEFAHRVDTGARGSIAELFSPEGSWQAGPDPVVGQVALAAYFDRTDSPGPLTRHVVTNVCIDTEGNDVATGRALVMWFRFERPGPDLRADVVDDSGPYRVYLGEYRDRFVRTPVGWRFAARVRSYVQLTEGQPLTPHHLAATGGGGAR
jgi:hypothetical protein